MAANGQVETNVKYGSFESVRNGDTHGESGGNPYRQVIASFRNYELFSSRRVLKIEEFKKSFPEYHQQLLMEYSAHLSTLFPCFEANQQIFDLMTEKEEIFENHSKLISNGTTPNSVSSKCEILHNHGQGVYHDSDDCHVILKQIVRDWTTDGQAERNLCYRPILEELEARFATAKADREIKVLVPGAGLGRLTHEIARRGYSTEGNEASFFMLLASKFILNRCSDKNLYTCYPWVHQRANVLNRKDQIRGVYFPDINPSDLPPNSKLVMRPGDFLEVYKQPEQEGAWDCVVTSFFIDCAKNVVDFLERILYCLKANGVWICLGPLLYYYADAADEKSIEPPYDVLAEIIRKMGFKIEKEVLDIPTPYADNHRSMLTYTYRSVFLVCTKQGLTK